jgi:hypothetical protein
MSDFLRARDDLNKAAQARRKGLEGQARVLSRLAAASAVKAYLAKSDQPIPSTNAYEILVFYSQSASLPARVRFALDHLLMKVDQDYNLPDGIDLLADVEELISYFESVKL